MTDAPISLPQGAGLPMWSPTNYEADRFRGPTPLRIGLEQSIDTLTVRVATMIGMNPIADTIERFGILDHVPHEYSITLGVERPLRMAVDAPPAAPEPLVAALETRVSALPLYAAALRFDWRRDEPSLSFAVSVRSKDLKFAVDELARLNGKDSGPFAGKLDLNRIDVAGHSLGGLVALLGLKQEARFKAAVLVDASLPDGSASVTQKPVLVLTMGREQWSLSLIHI